MMKRYKFPRIYHFPFSPGCSSDDKIFWNYKEIFNERFVVVTEKMDGENTTIYSDGFCHARSIDSKGHWSRDWVKAQAPTIGLKLPDGFRIIVENLYATHSIKYDSLENYLQIIAAFDNDRLLDWKRTIMISNQIDIPTPPVLFSGIFDEKIIKNIISELDSEQEGIVCRLYEPNGLNVTQSYIKYVRANHVQTDEHWMFRNQEINRLRNKEP